MTVTMCAHPGTHSSSTRYNRLGIRENTVWRSVLRCSEQLLCRGVVLLFIAQCILRSFTRGHNNLNWEALALNAIACVYNNDYFYYY